MLVLTRKKGERVLIGDDIVVTLIDVRGDGVRIGFDAPRGVKIQRAEVLRAVTDANTGAAANSAATADVLVGLLTARAAAQPAEQRQEPTGASEPVLPSEPAQPAAEPGDAAPAARPKPTPPRARP